MRNSLHNEHFPGKERLKKDKEFAHIFKFGKRRQGRNLTVIHVATSQDAVHNDRRIGIVISRHIKGSVIRNRLKRRLRDIYRRNKDYFLGDTIIIAYPGAECMSYSELNDEILKLNSKITRGRDSETSSE